MIALMNKPIHIAIIMDGNRRWAKNKGLNPAAGHRAGIDALEKVVQATANQGIKFLTVYALSTENLKNRDKLEIGHLFSLLQRGFVEKLPVLKKEGVKVSFLGEIERLPLPVRKTLQRTQQLLGSGKRLQLNIAINYGSRAEIVAGAKRVLSTKKITEESFSKSLNTAGIPDPDLIIRTGGEKRLSNFLLWEAAYSELYFIDLLWPDFDEKSLKTALEEFEKRKRNFGS